MEQTSEGDNERDRKGERKRERERERDGGRESQRRKLSCNPCMPLIMYVFTQIENAKLECRAIASSGIDGSA